MPQYPLTPPPIDLRLTPEQIPQMREAVEAALNVLTPALLRLRENGHIREPWLGDETSAAFVNYYNATVMDSPVGARAHIEAFRDELVRVRDALVAAEHTYQDAEAGNRQQVTRI